MQSKPKHISKKDNQTRKSHIDHYTFKIKEMQVATSLQLSMLMPFASTLSISSSNAKIFNRFIFARLSTLFKLEGSEANNLQRQVLGCSNREVLRILFKTCRFD